MSYLRDCAILTFRVTQLSHIWSDQRCSGWHDQYAFELALEGKCKVQKLLKQ